MQSPAAVQDIYMSLQRIYAVGVQHHGQVDFPEQVAHHCGHAVSAAQAGADQADAAAGQPGHCGFPPPPGRAAPPCPQAEGGAWPHPAWPPRWATPGPALPPSPGPRRSAPLPEPRTPARRYSPRCRPGDRPFQSPLVGVPGPDGQTDIRPLHRLYRIVLPVHQVPGYADVRHGQHAGAQAAFAHIMARLGKREGDRPRRAHPLPSTLPVSASTPLGMSADTTGMSQVFIM